MPKKAAAANVQVYVRARPFNSREKAQGESGTNQILSFHGANACRMLNPKKDMEALREEFVFDHCFDSTADGRNETQADVYNKMGPQLIDNCMDGYNACLFAYGQTGSGKTHTMMGELTIPEERGLIPRLIDELFERIESKKAGAASTFNVEASYLEIYCERVNDLLVKNGPDLNVRSNPDRGVYVDGLSAHKVAKAQDIYRLLDIGARNRAVAATNMNARSSRSHAILTLAYEEKAFASSGGQKVQTRSKTSRVYLVDLAGSERTKSTGCTGANLEEAKKINQSLTTLGRVIDMLADRKPGSKLVLPVRESLLTWLLADSLGGNSKTIMLAAVSPSGTSFDETLNTLRYAARTKCIVNDVSVNEKVDMKMMDDLRGQIDELQELLKNAQGKANQEQMEAMERMLEEERLAKERSDAELRERSEAERKELQDKLSAEKALLEQELQQENQNMQSKLDETLNQLAEAEQRAAEAARQADQEKKMMQDTFERALKDLTNQSMHEKQELQGKVDDATKRLEDTSMRLTHLSQQATMEKRDLQAKLDEVSKRSAEVEKNLAALEQQRARDKVASEGREAELQRSLADAQRDMSFQQQGWSQEKQFMAEKLDYVTRRCTDIENEMQAKEEKWNQAKDSLASQADVDLAKLQNEHQAKLAEVTQAHSQALSELQKQSEERFKTLREDAKQQCEEEVQRLQQQHEAATQAAKKQHEEACARLKEQHEQALAEALEAAKQNAAEDCEQLTAQHEEVLEEFRATQRKQEELTQQLHAEAKKQYEEECQRLREQQTEAVKEAHRKTDGAVLEIKKKCSEEIAKQKQKHDERYSKMKAHHDDALSALQRQIDDRWRHLTQEHANDLARQREQSQYEIDELEKRVQDAEGKAGDKQAQADRALEENAAFIKKLREKLQTAERERMEEVSNLGQTVSTLRRLLEQQMELSKQMEEQMKANQRRLETSRNAILKETQSALQGVPDDLQWAANAQPQGNNDAGLKSPSSVEQLLGASSLSPLKNPALTPSARDGFGSPTGLVGYRTETPNLGSPNIMQHYKSLVPSESVMRSPPKSVSSPKKLWDEEEEGSKLENTMGSFNAGDNSGQTHPDEKPNALEF